MANAPQGRGPPRPGLAVLVVEDEVLVALDLELMLERQGWRVLGPVATVSQALRLLRSEMPNVALLDIELRGEMVTPVAEKLQALGVPFLLSSAYSSAKLPAAILATAPNIGKPVTERRLLAALEEVMTL